MIVPRDKWGQCGIVVTEEMLKRIGVKTLKRNSNLLIKLSINALGIEANFKQSANANEILLWIPVYAVVTNLPQKAEFLLTPSLYNCLTSSFAETKFVQLETNVVGIISTGSQIRDAEKKAFYKLGVEAIDHEKAESGYEGEFLNNKIYLSNPISLENLDSVLSGIKNNNILGCYADFECVNGFKSLERPQYLSFYFSELNNVRKLRKYLKEKYNLELDMTAIEEKENFSKVSLLTGITTFILFLIGLICISLFIWFFLKNHLENSSKNLGTLNAFGLDSKTISDIYLNMIKSFMLKACLAGVFAIICVTTMVYLISGEIVAKLWDGYFIGALVITFVLNIVIARSTINRILLNTPGDLIYGRI